MFDVKTVSERIKEARIKKNLTQSNLADELGVSFQAVSNWERGNFLEQVDVEDGAALAELAPFVSQEMLRKLIFRVVK